ncbi:Fc.00g082110.m01.CDS01 [Cosmosporella sp. VM-42]
MSALLFRGEQLPSGPSAVFMLNPSYQRNLVDHGGWLDEVLWVVNTDDEADLHYLDEVISSNPIRYKKLAIPGGKLWSNTYYKAWQHLERGKYYVKIDDDIVWIEDDAIPRLVTRKLNNPDDFVVSANVINNPPLGFMHYRMGALHPYLPEIDVPSHLGGSWKPSEHPFWDGPSSFTWSPDEEPPRYHHRWLRVKDDKMMVQTPATQLQYEVWGNSYSNWAIAAQMHYSLLENIEEDELYRYKFNAPWNMNGERIRINFICVYADDILDTDIEHWPRDKGDEDMIVMDLPLKLNRRK